MMTTRQRTALVTGSTGGIGAQVAEALSARGYRLVLMDMDRARLDQQAALYKDARVEVLDLADQPAVVAWGRRLEDSGECVDVAFVNAGLIAVGELVDLPTEKLLLQLQVNLMSTAVMVQALARRMSAAGQGHLIATVSMGGIVSLKGSAAYSASKFGLRGLLWGLRDELRPRGVHVCGIYPAGVDTPMLRHEARHGGSALNFVGRPVSVDTVARAVARAIDQPRLETYVPASEGVTGRIAGAFPGLLARLYPWLEKIGERGPIRVPRAHGRSSRLTMRGTGAMRASPLPDEPFPAASAGRTSMALLRMAWLCLLVLLLSGCAALPPRGAAPVSHALQPDQLGGTRLAEVVAASQPADVATPDGFRLLTSGEHAFDTRAALGDLAERSIDAQYFQVHADQAGHVFLRALRDAARRGVRVRLLVDDFFAADVYHLLLALAQEPRAQVRTFNPLPHRWGSPMVRLFKSWPDFERVNRRMHNKLFIADGQMAIYGGRNVADEYFMGSSRSNFVDLDVLAVGPQVGALSTVFDRYWNSEHAWPVDQVPGVGRVPEADSPSLADWKTARPPVFDGVPQEPFGQTSVRAELARGVLQLRWGRASVQADDPGKVAAPRTSERPSAAMSAKLDLIAQARREVLVMNPYFVPGEFGLRLVADLQRRGVQLTVFTNSLASTDVPLVHRAYARYREAMLRLGARLHEVNPDRVKRSRVYGEFRDSSPRIHAKVAAVDQRWLLVGSVNLDPRSATLNTELSVNIDCPELVADALTALGAAPWPGMYSLSLSADGRSLRWRALGADEPALLHESEPDDSVWLRFLHWMQGLVVHEDHL